jgi:hypothetical protein
MTAAAALTLTAPATNDGPYEALTRKTDRELDAIFAASPAPDPRVLVGYEWRGYNTPRFTRVLGIQRFIKGFFEVGGAVEGYNLRVAQRGGLSAPWIAKPSPDAPAAFGFFTVTQPKPSETLLDYGASRRNRWWRIDDVTMKVLRDYLVVPDAAHPDIMLGKALMQLGPFRVFSNYFVVEKLRPAVWEPPSETKRLPAA